MESAGDTRSAGYDQALALFDDVHEMLHLCDDCAMRSTLALAVLDALTPTWVPTATTRAVMAHEEVTTRAAATHESSARSVDIEAVIALGVCGLMIFEESPLRFRECLPAGYRQPPEVDVDAIMWAWVPAGDDPDGRDTVKLSGPDRIEVWPLTRSRALAPIRGPGWQRSVLTDITTVAFVAEDVPQPGSPEHELLGLLSALGSALQRNMIRKSVDDTSGVGMLRSVVDDAA